MMASYLDPHNASFAAAIADDPGPHLLGYEKGREALEMLQKHEAAPDVVTETIEVPGKCGPTSVTVVKTKAQATKKLPMVYYLHGGGWILGSPAAFAPLLADLARRTGAAIVFPYYTPAPEKQYPFQFEQTYEVLDYMVRHGGHHNLLTQKIALAGDSVGGHMVIALMQMSLERSLPAEIGHLVLFYPVTDTHRKMPSYERYKDGPFLMSDTMDWMINAFLPNKKDRETALASPLVFLPDQVLARFPPTTVVLAAVDPLLDEGMAFGARLQNAGVDASMITAEGQMHAFLLLKPLREGPTARAIMDLVSMKLRAVLPLAAWGSCSMCGNHK